MKSSRSRDIHKQSHNLIKDEIKRGMQATNSRNKEIPKKIPTTQNKGGVGRIPKDQKQKIPDDPKVATAEL
jgi:hypothetical protein